jgi:flagellar biosynthesis GTPase FlhF
MSATKLQDALAAAGLSTDGALFAELPAEARAALEVILSYEDAPVLPEPSSDDGAADEADAKAAAKKQKKAAKKAEKAAAAAAEAEAEAAKKAAKKEEKAEKAAAKAAKKAAKAAAKVAAAEEEAAAEAAAAAPASAKKKKKKKKSGGDDDDDEAAASAKKKKKKGGGAAASKESKGKKSFLRVVGAGSGGITEMQSKLLNDAVYYGLLRFDVGSGSFVRTKRIFVHFSGDDCPMKKRNAANTSKGKVKGLLGQCAAEMVLNHTDECTIEQVGARFSTLFASDHGDFDVGALKADYEAMISSMFGASVKDKLKKLSKSRKTAAELIEDEGRKIPGKKALQAVRDPLGPFNWIILEPHATKIKMINAGSLSVDEMDKWLKPDYCAAVLLRMGFGSGPFRRTKWIACWWSPDGLSPMKRGKAMGLKKRMMSLLEPYSITIEATDKTELTLETIIGKVKAAVAVDHHHKTGVDGDDEADVFSLESFLRALDEELGNSKAYFGEEGTGKAKALDFDATMKKLHKGKLNWGLFEVAGK